MEQEQEKFREYINRKYGSYFRITPGLSNENSFLDTIRNSFIDLYKQEPPGFMISISYFRETRDIKTIQENNKRINNVLDDLFNPRNNAAFYVTKNHFLEKRDAKLKKMAPIKVKNTIAGDYEYDFSTTVVEGSFDTHHLIGQINNLAIENSPRTIRRIIPEIYGTECPPEHLLEEKDFLDLKMDLMEYTLRERCKKFIGTSQQSIKITPVDARKSWDGFPGWMGLVAYVTKTIKTPEDYLICYDHENSDLTK